MARQPAPLFGVIWSHPGRDLNGWAWLARQDGSVLEDERMVTLPVEKRLLS